MAVRYLYHKPTGIKSLSKPKWIRAWHVAPALFAVRFFHMALHALLVVKLHVTVLTLESAIGLFFSPAKKPQSAFCASFSLSSFLPTP
jgi:hypothetical protein